MKWLETYNDWCGRVSNQFSDWLFDHCLKFDSMVRKYVPAIGMTLVGAFVAFVVFLLALELGAVKFR